MRQCRYWLFYHSSKLKSFRFDRNNNDTYTFDLNNSNCVELLHTEWVDEVTELDEAGESFGQYNGLSLKGWVKNTCNDKIVVGSSNQVLNIGVVDEYLNDRGLVWNRADYLTDTLIDIPPYDSIYIAIIYFNLYNLPNLDSLNIRIHYKINKKMIEQLVEINAENISTLKLK